MTIEIPEMMVRFEGALDNYLRAGEPIDKDVAAIVEAARYAVLGPASRRRQILLTLGAELFDDNPYDRVMPVACAVEFCHTASLVFDDLPQQDNAMTRRGKHALHVRYDEATAQLVGIYLNTLSYEVAFKAIESFPAERVIKAIISVTKSAGLEGLVSGQHQDLRLKRDDKLTLNELEEFYCRKTANFIGAIASSAAILYGRDRNEVGHLYGFGRFSGLALQFTDDCNSIEAGNGEDDGKLTAITALGLEATKRMIGVYIERALKELEVFGDAAARLKGAVGMIHKQIS